MWIILITCTNYIQSYKRWSRQHIKNWYKYTLSVFYSSFKFYTYYYALYLQKKYEILYLAFILAFILLNFCLLKWFLFNSTSHKLPSLKWQLGENADMQLLVLSTARLTEKNTSRLDFTSNVHLLPNVPFNIPSARHTLFQPVRSFIYSCLYIKCIPDSILRLYPLGVWCICNI